MFMHKRDNLRSGRGGHLKLNKVDLVGLAQKYGTPLYVMDEDYMRSQCRRYLEAFRSRYENTEVLFASKAFLMKTMAALVRQEGLSIDVVSGSELALALSSGMKPENIHFHGNNKSAEEIAQGLKAGIGRFIVDNFDELDLMDELAGKAGAKADIMLRLAPGVEAHTHKYIQTGQTDSKFGLGIADGRADKALDMALTKKNIVLHGFHCHIGSQIFDIEAYRLAAEKMVAFAAATRKRTGFVMKELNLGGGLGVRYTEKDEPSTIEQLAEVICSTVKAEAAKHKMPLPKLMVEPGRSIVGEAGITLYTVGAIKDIPGVRTYVCVDGGMGDNIRPAIYDAKYEALLANRAGAPNLKKVTVAGKYCESGDILIRDIEMPEIKSGDVLAIPVCGAYCIPMSSNYNMVPHPAIVMVNEGKARLIRRRQKYTDLMKYDVMGKA
jgi:diaminopimelate decarboxylase